MLMHSLTTRLHFPPAIFLATIMGYLGVAGGETTTVTGIGQPADQAMLKALIKPSESEVRWMEVGWETDLWAARERAAREGKPLFLWEMDGHPLGCT